MSKEVLHIYTRVSTRAQQEDGTSLATQKDLGIKKAKECGFESRVWNEGGASSHYEDLQNRPVLLALLSEMSAGRVRHLWVYNNDRLSRNDITAQFIRAALQKHGVTLYTENGKFDLNNHQDKLIKTIFDGLAQFDNALRSERTRLGKLSRIKKGFWMGGPPPFGFEIRDKRLELNRKESKWIKKIYEWYSAGKSIEWIKSSLDKEGVETRRNVGLWTLGSIQKILKNTHPIGQYTYVDAKTGEVIKSTCPPIISTTLWNKCQEKRKLTLARRGQNNRTKRFYLLRNLLYCGHCGSPMSGRIKEDKNENLYYCPRKERQWVKSAPKDENKWKRGTGCGMTRSMNIAATDSLIVKRIIPHAINESFLKGALKNHAAARNGSSLDGKITLEQLKVRHKRLLKEAESTIQSIADVESAQILGKRDERIAKRIIENLTTELREAEAKIQQSKIEMLELQERPSYEDMKYLKPKLNYVQMTGVDFTPKYRGLINSIVERIDASYDSENKEHQLVVRFKLPLSNGQNDVSLTLKKNKKAA